MATYIYWLSNLYDCSVPLVTSCEVPILQVKHKYNGTVMDIFRELFCWLPLAHVINKRVIVVHGGLFARDGVTLDDIRKIDRNRCTLKAESASQSAALVASGM